MGVRRKFLNGIWSTEKQEEGVGSGGTGETDGKEERWKMKDYGNCHGPIYPYLRPFIQRKLLRRSCPNPGNPPTHTAAGSRDLKDRTHEVSL